MKAIVFGSSGVKEGSQGYQDAYEIGKILAENNFDVISGGYTGTMESVSKGAREAGRKTTGITCKNLDFVSPNAYLSEIIETDDIFERMKSLITADCGLIIVLPGGSGTLAELIISCDLISLGKIPKKPVLLLGDYWKNIIEQIEKMNNAVRHHEVITFIKDINELKEHIKRIKNG